MCVCVCVKFDWKYLQKQKIDWRVSSSSYIYVSNKNSNFGFKLHHIPIYPVPRSRKVFCSLPENCPPQWCWRHRGSPRRSWSSCPWWRRSLPDPQCPGYQSTDLLLPLYDRPSDFAFYSSSDRHVIGCIIHDLL